MQIIPTMIDYQTSLAAAFFNQIPLEETNFISSSGISPNSSDLFQLGKSVANYAAAGNYYLDNGAANSYVLSPVSGGGLAMRGVTRYFTGATYQFIPVNTNTGASVANINGLGVRNILLPNGADLQPGDLEATKLALLSDNGTNLILLNGQISLTTPWAQGYQYHCYVNSNAGAAATDVDFSIGKARDQMNQFNISLNNLLTKKINAAWIAGTGVGGLPSNLTLSPNTTYAMFIIANDRGDVDAGFDTDFSAANLLATSGYQFFRRRGFLVTDISSNIIKFYQRGDDFIYSNITDTQQVVDSIVVPELTVINAAPTASVKLNLFHSFTSVGNTSNFAMIYSPIGDEPNFGTEDDYFTAWDSTTAGDFHASTNVEVVCDDTGAIYVVNELIVGENNIMVRGWTDERED